MDEKYERNGTHVKKAVDGGGEMPHFKTYRLLSVSPQDGKIINDGADTEKVTISVVDGLEVARGTGPAEATVLGEDHTATVEIDGSPVDVPITDGSGTKEITTTKRDGSTISVEAVGLDGVPAESDSATIEVTN